MAMRKSPSRSQPGGKPASNPLIREALLLSLRRKDGDRLRLQLVADALVDAAIKGEMAALRELCQRVDGKISDTASGGEGNGPVDLEIKWPTVAKNMPGAAVTWDPAPGSKP